MRIAIGMCAAAMLVACGGGDGGTETPPPTAVPAAVTVSASTSEAMTSIGDTRTLTASVRDAAGAALPNATVTWTSDNAAVTVSGSGATATATAAGNGSATITARSGTVSATLPLSVAQRFASVALTAPTAPLAAGATQQLAASARDARGNAIAGATGFTFTTGDQSKVAVSPAGVVTAIAPGSATITASLTRDGITAAGTAGVSVTAIASASSSANVAATTESVFTPATVDVGTGGSVTWTFGSLAHNVTFRGTVGAPANIPATTSASASRTFNTPGTFNYDCTLHAGMTGVVNVRSTAFTASLNGANERPNPVTTTASGFSAVTVNGGTGSYVVTFTGLSSAPVMAHIHGPGSANVAVGVLVNFPTAAATGTTGVLTGTFTAADIRGATGQPPISMDSLVTLMRTGNAYVNVHTQANGGGEIRGQLGPPAEGAARLAKAASR
jgi:plastocyanin